MTMFPAAHRLQNHLIKNKNTTTYGTAGYEYGGGCGYTNYDQCFISLSSGGGGGSDLDLKMDDDDQLQGDQEESRTEIYSSINKDEEEEETTSKDNNNNNTNTNTNTNHDEEMIKKEDEDEDRDEWLELSLGSTGRRRPSSLEQLDLLPAAGHTTSSGGGGAGETNLSLTLTAAAPRQLQYHHLSFEVPITTAARTAGFILQPDEGGWAVAPMATTTSSHQQQYQYQYEDTINYMPAAFRPNYQPLSTSASSLAAGQLLVAPLITGPPLRTMDFRVVDPPPRPHSGVWFILQASLNQIKEPYLPQVPKSYLRIKDGRTTTVGLVIKYLVHKLKLDTEFQVEITCKGQQLLPFLTLQHVRDNIWNRPRNDVVFSPSSTTINDHLMVLNYGRIA